MVDPTNADQGEVSEGSILMVVGWDGGTEATVALKKFRRMAQNLPILVVGTTNDPALRISAFRLGADNYMGSYISRVEFLAKVRRLQYLANQWNSRRAPISVSSLQIFPESRLVMHNGRDIHLSRREFETLAYLAKEYPRPVKRETLEREVLGHRHDPGTNAIAVHVHRLRKKLKSHGAVLETVPGRGYRLK